MRVTDPTMTSLNVNWDPADGAVRLYKVFYVPAAGGREEMVRLAHARLTLLDEAAVEQPFLNFPFCLLMLVNRSRFPQAPPPSSSGT